MTEVSGEVRALLTAATYFALHYLEKKITKYVLSWVPSQASWQYLLLSCGQAWLDKLVTVGMSWLVQANQDAFAAFTYSGLDYLERSSDFGVYI